MDCVFCAIAAGKIPADMVYQDEEIIAFRDTHPQAPSHIVIMPKTHIASVGALTTNQERLMGRLILVARELAEKEGMTSRGYRLVINCGDEGGQSVPHLHLHLLGGRKLSNALG